MLTAPLLILAAVFALLLATSWRKREARRPILLLGGMLVGLLLFGGAVFYLTAGAHR